MASRQQCRSASVSPTREPESGKENATSKLPPPDVLEENIAAQRDEIFALQSIYEEDFTVQPIMHCPKSDKDPPVNECMPQPSSGLAETTTDDLLIGFVGSLLLRVVLPSDPMALVLPPQLMNAEPDVGQGAPNDGTAPTATVATTPITHLPPVTLRFHLPPTYPSSSIPHLALQCSWLPAQHLDALRRRVAAICKEEGTGSVVLFLIADFVVNDAIGWLGLVSTSSDEVKPSGDFVLDLSAPLSVQASSLLPRTSKAASKSSPTTAPTLATITAILDHDKARIDHLFAQSSITCGICLDSKRGSNCKRFTYNPKDPNSRGCGHAYCNDCLVSYFTLHITEGSISLVTCPNETCKKQTHPPTLPDDDLCALVGDALMSRYTELRTKAQLESQPDMIHCPRALCQHPTKKPAPPEKLCICDACAYPFCFYCLRTWHGNQVSCPIDSITALAARYATARAADDAAELAYLDARYGRAVLDRILRAEEERRLNADWLKAHSQRCPDCACAVERSEGCAHMTCRVCKTHFCFLCGVRLRPDNPYAHYSDRTAPCFGRLFDGADVDAEPPDHVWFDEEEEDGG
ncbi:hypothetical protein DFJ73DRAFT_647923 [Zopfochytrium polystomum]|nr:hypothetical protein DFJ73DRAFT_647923 [Zopfochytrium polystomum]